MGAGRRVIGRAEAERFSRSAIGASLTGLLFSSPAAHHTRNTPDPKPTKRYIFKFFIYFITVIFEARRLETERNFQTSNYLNNKTNQGKGTLDSQDKNT